MPQGEGTYGKQVGRPPEEEKNSGFKMRSGNATPFKQMGASPAKQIGPDNPYGDGRIEQYKGSSLTKAPIIPVQPIEGGSPSMIPIKGGDAEKAKKAMLNKRLQEIMSNPTTPQKPPPTKQGTPGGDAGEAIDHWVKYKKGLKKKAKKVKNIGKKIVKGATKRLPLITIASMLMGKTASADQPGTGTHGGKKQTYYNPKTGKYE
tara:strand:+ start:47 stop:658 length:612 start_codon:yes stop_codon:yes gene_type:complete